MKLKIVVVGTGYWGKNLVRNFSQLGVLIGVCDENLSISKPISEEYNVPILSWTEVLNDRTIDGVVIAVPAAYHARLALEAIEAGKHVFIEKPLALNIEDAEKICDLAERCHRIVMVGHLLQYHPAYIKLKEMVHEEKLGKLQYIYSTRLNLGKIRQEEDILWSFAPHDISMIIGLAGSEPSKVLAVGGYHLNKCIADTTTTHLIFNTGMQAHIFVSWLHPIKEQKLVVVGDKGMAVFDDGEGWEAKLKYYPHQITWQSGVPIPEKAKSELIQLEAQEPLSLECKHFIECIINNTKPTTDGYEGLRVLKVLQKASFALNENNFPNSNLISVKNKRLREKDSSTCFIHESAYVDEGVEILEGSKIWHYSHILKGSKIGKNCNIGQNVMIGPDVKIGNNCKIQNNVSLYKGIILEEGVFCGPSCVFTNVKNPRAEINRQGEFDKTHVEKGVTIGANATIVCGIKLGAYSFIGAGAVVTKNVNPHALMVGNPARQIGWVSHSGEKLDKDFICKREGRRYKLNDLNLLEEI
ncbi:MAG: NAD-dependent oxidoreductase [Francisellaceae bacterium]|nr:NAD-dependent oxidoreductase [Francisellaceae bacterium]